MELDAVKNSYARWAPVYDATFGRITHAGRREAVRHINARGGHVLSAVPEPARVMTEIARVLRPGGQVVITNHFRHERGVWAGLARAAAPLERVLGWQSDFEIDTILQDPRLHVVTRRDLPPMGMMTFLVLEKWVN